MHLEFTMLESAVRTECGCSFVGVRCSCEKFLYALQLVPKAPFEGRQLAKWTNRVSAQRLEDAFATKSDQLKEDRQKEVNTY